MIAAIYAGNALNLGARFGVSDSDAQILYFAGSLLLTLVLIFVTAYYYYCVKKHQPISGSRPHERQGNC